MNKREEADGKARMTKVVYAAIDTLNEQLSQEQRLEKNLATVLLGNSGKLDSVGFINLIVLIEEKLHDDCGVSMSLSDALNSTDANPFQTINSLTEYLWWLIEEKVSQ